MAVPHPLFRYLNAVGADGERRTQADLAERAGITGAYLSQLLSGERSNISPEIAAELSRATGGAITEHEITWFGRKRRRPVRETARRKRAI